jgi:hypothetical protein
MERTRPSWYLSPSIVKEMSLSPGPLDPQSLQLIVEKFGFPYRTVTGLLIFAVQIVRLDIAASVTILCKFNDRPAEIHFQAAKSAMRYLRRTAERGLIYWHPREINVTISFAAISHPSGRAISSLLPDTHPLLDHVCYVDASFNWLLVLGDPRSVTGVVIILAAPRFSHASASNALLPSPPPNRRLSLAAMPTRSSHIFDSYLKTFAFHSQPPHPPAKTTKAPSVWPPITDPMVALGTWTFKISPLKNGPSEMSWNSSKSSVLQTLPTPCPKSSTGYSLRAISIACRVTMALHTLFIPCFIPIQTIIPHTVDCFLDSVTYYIFSLSHSYFYTRDIPLLFSLQTRQPFSGRSPQWGSLLMGYPVPDTF